MYLLTKRLGVPIVDVMAERYELLRELECITDAVARFTPPPAIDR